MWKPNGFAAWLGLCGFLIGAALYIYSALFDYTKPLTAVDAFIGLLAFIFCPPTLLLVLCIDCQVGGVDGMITFLLLGLMNAALYYAIGSLVAWLRKARS